MEIVQNNIENEVQSAEEQEQKRILKQVQKREASISLEDMKNEVKNLQNLNEA